MKTYSLETRKLTSEIVIYDQFGEEYITMRRKGFWKVRSYATCGSTEYEIVEKHKLFENELTFMSGGELVAHYERTSIFAEEGIMTLESGEKYTYAMEDMWKRQYRLERKDDLCLRIEFEQQGLKIVGKLFFEKVEGDFFLIALAYLTLWKSNESE